MQALRLPSEFRAQPSPSKPIQVTEPDEYGTLPRFVTHYNVCFSPLVARNNISLLDQELASSYRAKIFYCWESEPVSAIDMNKRHDQCYAVIVVLL